MNRRLRAKPVSNTLRLAGENFKNISEGAILKYLPGLSHDTKPLSRSYGNRAMMLLKCLLIASKDPPDMPRSSDSFRTVPSRVNDGADWRIIVRDLETILGSSFYSWFNCHIRSTLGSTLTFILLFHGSIHAFIQLLVGLENSWVVLITHLFVCAEEDLLIFKYSTQISTCIIFITLLSSEKLKLQNIVTLSCTSCRETAYYCNFIMTVIISGTHHIIYKFINHLLSGKLQIIVNSYCQSMSTHEVAKKLNTR